METCESLISQGWFISPDGFNILTNNGTFRDRKTVLQNALNTDLKDIGSPVLTVEIEKDKTGKVVLQIQKIRNVSAPKSRADSQAAPRMLKLILTDGHSHCQAIEAVNISALSTSTTVPGSKLLINGAKVVCGSLFLRPNCCTYLGGQVPNLYEKWVIANSISQHVRGSSSVDGPPSWVNFGQKFVSSVPTLPSKSLESKDTSKGNVEFEVQRQDAIAEAATGAVKKVFGGGARQLVQDKSVRANYNVKYQDDGSREFQREIRRGPKPKHDQKERVEEKSQKPSEKVSLFDFLEDKLPLNENHSFISQSESRVPHSVQSSYRQNTKYNREQSMPKKMETTDKIFVPSRLHSQNPVDLHSNEKVKFHSYVSSNHNSNESSKNNVRTSALNCVDDVANNMEKLSINSSHFSSKTLRQHLNLNNSESQQNAVSTWEWNVGDRCMAKYWEDNKYYNATVTGVTGRTCVVQFVEYGNIEEVLKTDCIPISDDNKETYLYSRERNKRPPYRGSEGFASKHRFTNKETRMS